MDGREREKWIRIKRKKLSQKKRTEVFRRGEIWKEKIRSKKKKRVKKRIGRGRKRSDMSRR